MKFFNYKRYKFSTIFKNTSIKRYDFKKILKYLERKEYSYFKISQYINLKRIYYYYSKFYNYINPKRYNYSKLLKYIKPKSYNFQKLYKFNDLKFIIIFLPIFALVTMLIYLSVPIFYEFNKSKTANLICKGFNVTCLIDGKIKYSFFPSPRIKLNNLVIKDPVKSSKILAEIKDVKIGISLKNLHKIEMIYYKNLNLKNGTINFDLKKLKKYQKILHTKFNLKNINFKKINIKFLDGKNELASIDNAVFKYKSKKNIDKVNLKGDFLNDLIVINLKNIKNESEVLSALKIKLVNSKLSSKLDIVSFNTNDNSTKGNFSIKKNKNKILAIFEYKDDQIIVKKGNLKNSFLDGKFNGILKILPYFTFKLDVNLNSINFNKVYNILVNLNEESRKSLFTSNKKINGEISLSANKIYSKHILFKSFESRTKFINGDIFLEQMLLSLPKLGATDITGTIKNDNKFTNFKFENNFFIDNVKKFYNKIGIYNKNLESPTSLYTSGNFDLINLNMRFNEINNGTQLSVENVNYYEKEFNNIFLEDGYKSLFKFKNLKKFVQLTTE
jgi:hypothetical protein